MVNSMIGCGLTVPFTNGTIKLAMHAMVFAIVMITTHNKLPLIIKRYHSKRLTKYHFDVGIIARPPYKHLQKTLAKPIGSTSIGYRLLIHTYLPDWHTPVLWSVNSCRRYHIFCITVRVLVSDTLVIIWRTPRSYHKLTPSGCRS